VHLDGFTRQSVSGKRERHELVTRAGFVLVAVDVEPGRPASWHGVAPLCVPEGTDWRIRTLEPAAPPPSTHATPAPVEPKRAPAHYGST
jgi:hypothetical protein